jgi:hypothetical protein
MKARSETADFFDVNSPKATVCNSTAALNAEPDISPKRRYLPNSTVMYKQGEKFMFTAGKIPNLSKTFLL